MDVGQNRDEHWTELRRTLDIERNHDGHRIESRQMLDKTITDVRQNHDRHRTEPWRMSNKIMTNIRRNCNGCRMEKNGRHYKVICVREFYNDDMQNRKEFFFLLLRVFFYSLLVLLPELLQGLLTTWLQAKKHIGVHSPDANFKIHVQGKQVYMGLHHLVQILYYNQTLCVCVRVAKT
jgi:hypothetical protein